MEIKKKEKKALVGCSECGKPARKSFVDFVKGEGYVFVDLCIKHTQLRLREERDVHLTRANNYTREQILAMSDLQKEFEKFANSMGENERLSEAKANLLNANSLPTLSKQLKKSAIKAWDKEAVDLLLDNHDCHISPEDSCDCQKING